LPDWICDGLAWFIAWLFALAACHKFAALDYYRQLVARYVGMAGVRVAWVWLLGVLEISIALSILLSLQRSVGLAGAAVVLLAYAALMAGQLLRGTADFPCGCAGPNSALGVSWVLVVRNAVCAALALLAMHPAGGFVPGWVGTTLSLLLTAFAVLVYQAIDYAVSNAQWMEGEG
jgi:uncharacterized membrane protein